MDEFNVQECINDNQCNDVLNLECVKLSCDQWEQIKHELLTNNKFPKIKQVVLFNGDLLDVDDL